MKIIANYIRKYKKEFVILFLFTILISGVNNILPLVSQSIFEQGILHKKINLVVFFSVITILLYVIKAIMGVIYAIQISKTANEVVMLEKNDVFNRIIKLSLSFFDKYSPQYILSRINELNSISGLISPSVFNFATGILSAAMALAFIIYKNIFLGIVCVFFMFILYKVTDVYMGQIGLRSRKLYEQTAKTNHNMHNAIQGLFTIKNLNRELTVQKDIENDIKELAKKNVQRQKIMSKGTEITTGTMFCINAILVGIIAGLVVNKKLKLSDYIALSQYISLVFAPIVTLQSLKIVTKPAFVSLERINEIINEEKVTEKDGEEEIQQIKKVDIINLEFSYNSNDEQILKDVNLNLRQGDKLALIGHNGCGKTTLVKILLGYYGIKEKQVFINGVDISKIKKSFLRDCIGFVPQNIFLFETTIYENIRIGNIDMDLLRFDENLKEIQEYGILQGMNLNTIVNDNGKNLSKGQIQQIAIARSLVKSHSLYIFDEATSYLDVRAREALQDYIKSKIKEQICIFICHNDEFGIVVNKQFWLE